MLQYLKHKPALLITIGIIILVIILTLIFLHFFLSSIIEQQLKKKIKKASENFYHVDISEFKFNALKGNLYAKEIYLIPDTLKKVLPESDFYYLRIIDCNIKNVRILKLFFRQTLQIDECIIKDAEIKVFKSYRSKNKAQTNKTKFPEHILKKIKIKHLKIQKSGFKTINRKSSTILFHLSGFQLLADGVQSSAELVKRRRIPIKWETLELRAAYFQKNFPDSYRFINGRDLFISSSLSDCYIHNFNFNPAHSKTDFYHSNKTQDTYWQLNTKFIKIKNFDLDEFCRNLTIKAKNVLIDGLDARIQRKKQLSEKDNGAPKKLPQELLRNMRFPLHIDTLNVIDGKLHYEDIFKNKYPNPKFYINRINAKISHLHNRQYPEKNLEETEIKFSGYLFGKGLLTVHSVIPIMNENNAHSISGSLNNMNFSELNPLLRPLTLIQARSGRVDKLYFELFADNRNARGKVRFYYSNLKIRVLKKTRKNMQMRQKKLVTFVINHTGLLRKNNPAYGNSLKTGKIFCRYNPQKSIVGYWMQCLLIGVMRSMLPESIEKRFYNKIVK